MSIYNRTQMPKDIRQHAREQAFLLLQDGCIVDVVVEVIAKQFGASQHAANLEVRKVVRAIEKLKTPEAAKDAP